MASVWDKLEAARLAREVSGPTLQALPENPLQRWMRRGAQSLADALFDPGGSVNQQVAEGFQTLGGMLSPVDPDTGMPNADFGSKAVVPLAVKLGRRTAVAERAKRGTPVIERLASTPEGEEHVRLVKEMGFEDTLRPKYETPGPRGSEIDRLVEGRDSLYHATRQDLARDIVESKQIGTPGVYSNKPKKVEKEVVNVLEFNAPLKYEYKPSQQGVSLGRINKIKTTIPSDVIFELNRRKMREAGVPTRPYVERGFEKMKNPNGPTPTYGQGPNIGFEFEERTYSQAIPLDREGMVRRAYLNLDRIKGRSPEELRKTVDSLLKVTDDIRPYHTPLHGSYSLHRQLPSNLMTRSGAQELPRVKSFEDLQDVLTGLMPVKVQAKEGGRKVLKRAKPVGNLPPSQPIQEKASVPQVSLQNEEFDPQNFAIPEAKSYLEELETKGVAPVDDEDLPFDTWTQIVHQTLDPKNPVQYPNSKKVVLKDIVNQVTDDLVEGMYLDSSLEGLIPKGASINNYPDFHTTEFLDAIENNLVNAPSFIDISSGLKEIGKAKQALQNKQIEVGLGTHNLWKEGDTNDLTTINPADLGGMTPSQAKAYISNYTGLPEGKDLNDLFKSLMDQFIKGVGGN